MVILDAKSERGKRRHREAEAEGGSQKERKMEAAAPPPPSLTPRSYQVEAFEQALRRNTMVILDTGSGKTLIAIMLLRSYAHAIRRATAKPNTNPIAVFLVPTVILVTQQADVIAAHTDLSVGRFYGEMGVDFWTAHTWNQMLRQYEVFVMTPQILLDNLRHTFFKIQHIKLLVFDECHHATRNHPYACIMKEFYHRNLKENSHHLPRIFAMTASPINTKGSNSRDVYSKKIFELECLMDSKVYAAADESVLAQYVPYSTTRIKQYTHVNIPDTLIHRLSLHLNDLKDKHLQSVKDLKVDASDKENVKKKIRRMHATFLYCLTELGLWVSSKAAELLCTNANHYHFWGERKDDIEKYVKKYCQLVFQNFSRYLPIGYEIGEHLESDVDAGFLTSKVCCLIECLLEYRKLPDLRCIIFVERVIVAVALHGLLCQIEDLSIWVAKYLVGNNSGIHSQSRAEQVNIVNAFRNGKVNIIVATQILEEGLDVPSCNLVIRFDPAATVCSFVQSQGRARMRGAEYILLIKSDDNSALLKVSNYIKSKDIIRQESLRLSSVSCHSEGNIIYDEEYYLVPSTGSIVTLNSSVALLYFYCSRLPSDGYFKPTPRFSIDKELNTCMLCLPKNCPIGTIFVEGKRDKLKQLACLEACKQLHEVGVLTDELLPEHDENCGDKFVDPDIAKYVSEQANYFPGELVDSWASFCARGSYHCYRIVLNHTYHEVSLDGFFLVVKDYMGIDLLSNSFSLYAESDCVTFDIKYSGEVFLSYDQVLLAKMFQVRILEILIHRDFDKYQRAMDDLIKNGSSLSIVYLVLPSRDGKIDWQSVESVKSTKECALETLQNAIVYTRHTGKFYFVSGIRSDLTANSSLKLKNGELTSYKDYYKSRHGLHLLRVNESLLDARHIYNIGNFIVRQGFQKVKEHSNAGVELPTELCDFIMSLSIQNLYTFSFVPSIMHRIQSFLLAIKLKIQLSDCMPNAFVDPRLILEALTTKKCQESFSMETLETLGDSFIKYAVSQYLYQEHRHCHEGVLSAKKERMISNAALCDLGCGRNIPGFIRTDIFNPQIWSIPGNSYYCLDKNVASSPCSLVFNLGSRHMKSKVVADSVEALVGAYLSSSGELAAFFFLEWLGMGIKASTKAVALPIIKRPEIYVNIDSLETLLGYKFQNPSLLVEALVHGSYMMPDVPSCYQRLEFLGDAVLDHVITEYLYNKYPGLTPGLLTDLRSASANNDCYAHAAAKASLNKYILHASTDLHEQITCYLESSLSFSGSSYGFDAGVALPKVLGDVIESLSGAIFVDSGFKKEVVWKSIRPLLEPIVSPATIKYHPVRELVELCSRMSYSRVSTKSFENGITSVTEEVEVDGVVYKAVCSGKNIKTAKKLAARAVLGVLKKNVPGLKNTSLL